MPAMANIIVKKADAVTDSLYTAMSPSSGDGVAAKWRIETGFPNSAAKPTFELATRNNGPKTARRVETTFKYPHTSTDTTTGLTSIVAYVPITVSAVIPLNVPDTVVAEAVAQGLNLFTSSTVRTCFTSGYAPS